MFFAIPYIIMTHEPKVYTIRGSVTRKRIKMIGMGKGGMHPANFISIGEEEKEFLCSNDIYNRLEVGSFISVEYKKEWVFDGWVITKLLWPPER